MPVPACQDLSTPLRLTIIGADARREWIGDMTAWLIALTDFGDLAVLIPVSAVGQASRRWPGRKFLSRP
jgi:hypothetical protein